MFKKIYYTIAGREDRFQFEHRIFNITCFTGTVFTGIGFVLNIVLALDWFVLLTSCIGLLYGGIQFYFSRIKALFKPFFIESYVIITNLLLGITFFYNSGTTGTVFYLMLVNFVVFMLIALQKQQLRISFIFVATISLLLVLEYLHPEWITGYDNKVQLLFDHATLLLYSLMFTGVIVVLFRRDYDRERLVITAQKQELATLYEKTTEKNQQIELLIHELHHRIKNNLQVVSGLMRLQSNRIADEKAKTALEESKARVDAMALLHQKLYIDQTLSVINMQEYLQQLSFSLAGSFGLEPSVIKINVSMEKEEMNIDKAVLLGLIVNELVTNAFKHAFQQWKEPALLVDLLQQQDMIRLVVADNGPGIPTDYEQQPGFGLRLVRILVAQLDAEMNVSNANGTRYIIQMKNA